MESLERLWRTFLVLQLCGGIHVSPWSHPCCGAIKGHFQIKWCAQSGIEHCNLNKQWHKSALLCREMFYSYTVCPEHFFSHGKWKKRFITVDKSRVFKRLQPEGDAFVCLAYYLLAGGGVRACIWRYNTCHGTGVVIQYIAKREWYIVS